MTTTITSMCCEWQMRLQLFNNNKNNSENNNKKQQTCLMALKSRLTWVSQNQRRTIHIQLTVSLSLLLSLQFPLIILLHLL